MPSPTHRSGGSLNLAATGAAIRRGDLKISDPMPYVSGDAYPSTDAVSHTRYLSGPTLNDSTWRHRTSPAVEPHYRHVSTGHVPNDSTMRASTGPSFMPSTMSSAPSKSSLTQKKSGFRAALKRLFSSKRHRSAPAAATDAQYFQSDPGHLNPVVERLSTPQADRTQLSAGVAPETALGSHSIQYRPNSIDVGGIQPPSRHGRRNTLPSLVFSDREAGLALSLNDWSGPASHHEEKWAREDCVSDGQLKRRSRSADALNELLRQGGVETTSSRNRASEIAYWRTSAIQNPVPVYSGQSIAVDPMHVSQSVDSVDEFERSSSSVNPLQTFDFGLNDHDGPAISLEQRVNTLEIKLFDFEYAIAKLQGTNIPKPMLQSRRSMQGSIHEAFADERTEPTPTSSQNFSFFSSPPTVHDITFLSSPGHSPSVLAGEDDLFRSQRASKATTVTIRPSTARPKSPRPPSATSIHIPAEKFEALLEILKQEQAARRKLEDQVMAMQRELDELRGPVYATIRESYPTPSPESSHTAMGTPRSLHRAPAFQSQGKEISRFSSTETESDVEEVDGFMDVYETPQERKNTFETARGNSPVLVA